MKFKTAITLMLGCISLGFAQLKGEKGMPFKPDADELEPEVVLADNYNHYLYTYMNKDGMMNSHQSIMRKFDQKNQLVDTYAYQWPKIDQGTLFNYLGVVEERNGKVATVTYTYSGRAKKSEIVKHEFDKAAAKFTSIPLLQLDIENSFRSGEARFAQSTNGNYIAVVFTKYRAKNAPEESKVMVYDANFILVWQKDIAQENEHTTKSITVTDNGTVVLLRDFASFKKDKNYNYLVQITAKGTEDKLIEGKIFLQQPVGISIGPKDYILAFNSNTRGTDGYNFDHLMLYDLENARILGNGDVKDFSSIKGVKNVSIQNVFVQSDAIEIFTEAKQVVVKGISTPQNRFPEDKLGYGPGVLYTMGFDGTLKISKELSKPIQDDTNLYHSYGLLNIKGNYYINTTLVQLLNLLDPAKGYALTPVNNTVAYEEWLYNNHLRKNVRQAMHYFPDSNKLLFLMQTDDQQLVFVNVTGAKL